MMTDCSRVIASGDGRFYPIASGTAHRGATRVDCFIHRLD